MVALVIILVVLVLAGLVAAGRSFKVVQQYEQGIIFRFGRVLPGTRGAGLSLSGRSATACRRSTCRSSP